MRTFITACALALCSGSAIAAVQITSGGKLLGARNVEIAGFGLYDVSFGDLTCEEAFGTCADGSFDFNTAEGAEAAGRALLDQVLIDTFKGPFGSEPYRTRGCDVDNIYLRCEVMIPFSFSEGYLGVADVYGGQVSTGGAVPDIARFEDITLAKFTLRTTPYVPEPASWAMMVAGFGAVGSLTRLRQKISVSRK